MADNSVVTFDDLLGDPRVLLNTFKRTLVSGEVVVRGEVLGKITSGGKIATYDAGAGDGTEVIYAIALEDTDASGGDIPIRVYITGEFKIPGLTFSASGDTATEAVQNDARALGIILLPVQVVP